VTVSAFDQDINVYNSVSNKYLRVWYKLIRESH
jgi:hypothetical protein